MTIVHGHAFAFTDVKLNGVPIKEVNFINHNPAPIGPDLEYTPGAETSWTGTMTFSWRGWYRFFESLRHAANLRNPRWLKRRARMRRKKKRGWA